MYVGVLRLVLRIPGARSLKDKRRAVLGLKDRLTSRFRVSVAEVGSLDDVSRGTLGVAVVSNEAAHCDSVLAEVAHAASMAKDAVLTDRRTEIVAFGSGGDGLRDGIESLSTPFHPEGTEDA